MSFETLSRSLDYCTDSNPSGQLPNVRSQTLFHNVDSHLKDIQAFYLYIPEVLFWNIPIQEEKV